jgi:succinate dehydrogenase/fumarate reductase flavoprotein subunit
VPISRPRRPDGTLGTFPHFVDRSKPGVIAVTRSGRRFVNEANSYHDFCQAMVARAREEGGEIAAWFVTDHRAFRRYGLGFAKPAPVPFGKLIRDGYLLRGATLRELAAQFGADGEELERTVARYNEPRPPRRGSRFRQGHDQLQPLAGRPDHKPNPCLAPIETGPFYAVKLVIGDLGTFAGLKADENARVLDERPAHRRALCGGQRHGLDHGGQLSGRRHHAGAAITFGYIAARHLAGANR